MNLNGALERARNLEILCQENQHYQLKAICLLNASRLYWQCGEEYRNKADECRDDAIFFRDISDDE